MASSTPPIAVSAAAAGSASIDNGEPMETDDSPATPNAGDSQTGSSSSSLSMASVVDVRRHINNANTNATNPTSATASAALTDQQLMAAPRSYTPIHSHHYQHHHHIQHQHQLQQQHQYSATANASATAATTAVATAATAPPLLHHPTHSSTHIEYRNVSELIADFQQSVGKEGQHIETAANYLYDSLIDEMVLGIAFEHHYAHRTGIMRALAGQPEDPKPFSLVTGPDVDVFGANCTKIAMDCTCPKCDRSVAASRFAPHLEKCMGMGRISSRIASRRLASTRDGGGGGGGGNYFGGGVQSDDEDDADWSGEKRKKKIQPVRTNGNKKNGKSSS